METLVSSELRIRLKLLRQQLGITAAQMAEEADISLPLIKSVEQGVTLNPGYNFIEKIVKRYGVNANWFVAGIGDIFQTNPQLERKVEELTAEVREKESLIQMLQRAMVSLKKMRRGAHQPDDLPMFRVFSPNLATSVTTRSCGTPAMG